MVATYNGKVIRMNRVDYIEKFEDGYYSGLVFYFYSGAYEVVWYDFYGDRDRAYREALFLLSAIDMYSN